MVFQRAYILPEISFQYATKTSIKKLFTILSQELPVKEADANEVKIIQNHEKSQIGKRLFQKAKTKHIRPTETEERENGTTTKASVQRTSEIQEADLIFQKHSLTS